MSDQSLSSIESCFSDIYDPRVKGRSTYGLLDILIIAICGVIAGAEDWTGIETFGKSKADWLKQFLDLEDGIPSHDTFGDVFNVIDGDEFQRCFMRWVESIFTLTEGEVIAIDGKTARRSHDKAIGKDAIHMVSAWASINGISLGQRKVDNKSNEITAIPELLDLLSIKGCIVTIDAMGCQKKIAQKVRDKQADYVLAVKDNQGKLHQDVQDWFAHADHVEFEGIKHSHHQVVNKGHGRIEIRDCWVIHDEVTFDYIRHYEGWADLAAIIRVCRERRIQDQIQKETAYYITSSSGDAKQLLNAIRCHWAIENSLHWVMDVTFNEDQMRTRKGNSSQNLVVLRHLALNILKRDLSKGSLKQKRYRAALDDTFLLQLLDQI